MSPRRPTGVRVVSFANLFRLLINDKSLPDNERPIILIVNHQIPSNYESFMCVFLKKKKNRYSLARKIKWVPRAATDQQPKGLPVSAPGRDSSAAAVSSSHRRHRFSAGSSVVRSLRPADQSGRPRPRHWQGKGDGKKKEKTKKNRAVVIVTAYGAGNTVRYIFRRPSK